MHFLKVYKWKGKARKATRPGLLFLSLVHTATKNACFHDGDSGTVSAATSSRLHLHRLAMDDRFHPAGNRRPSRRSTRPTAARHRHILARKSARHYNGDGYTASAARSSRISPAARQWLPFIPAGESVQEARPAFHRRPCCPRCTLPGKKGKRGDPHSPARCHGKTPGIITATAANASRLHLLPGKG